MLCLKTVVETGHLALPALQLGVIVHHPLAQLPDPSLALPLLFQVLLAIGIHALVLDELQLLGRLVRGQFDHTAIHPPGHQQEVLYIELQVEDHLAQESEITPVPDDPVGIESVHLLDEVGLPGLPEFSILLSELVEREHLGEHDVHHLVVVFLLVEEDVELAQHAHLQ